MELLKLINSLNVNFIESIMILLLILLVIIIYRIEFILKLTSTGIRVTGEFRVSISIWKPSNKEIEFMMDLAKRLVNSEPRSLRYIIKLSGPCSDSILKKIWDIQLFLNSSYPQSFLLLADQELTSRYLKMGS